ncbi:hypothetical protein H8E77_23800 [bacterium]|nr:hypothetical protein [bacterium]
MSTIIQNVILLMATYKVEITVFLIAIIGIILAVKRCFWFLSFFVIITSMNSIDELTKFFEKLQQLFRWIVE